MPASYTHQCFGDDVLPHLSTMLQDLIKSHKDYYDLGLQGPDLFFYFHPTRQSMVKEYGLKLHQESAHPFFEERIAYLHMNQDERAIAYMLGFINHYLLDSALHPLINKTGRHFACERDLDHFFIEERQPKNPSVADRFSKGETLCKILGTLMHMEPILIRKSISSFQFYGALLYNKHKPILLFCRSVLSAMRLQNADMVMIGNHDIDLSQIKEGYYACIEEASVQLENVYYAITHGTELSSRFIPNYYGEKA
jgi:hypothetical protein